jgi:plastocyanin
MRALLLGLMLLTVLVAGCFDGDDDDDSTTTTTGHGGHMTGTGTTTTGTTGTGTTTTGTTTGNNTPPRAAVTWTVEVRDNSFEPNALTVQVGDTVRFTYNGSNMHTATADNGEFDSGDCPGQTCFMPAVGRTSFEWTSEAVGEVPFHCEVHASMTGTITVLQRHDATPDQA